MRDILWKAHAPEKVLNMLHCTQLADSLRTWYIFRDKIVKKEFDNDFFVFRFFSMYLVQQEHKI